jgi:hypothetical protein
MRRSSESNGKAVLRYTVTSIRIAGLPKLNRTLLAALAALVLIAGNAAAEPTATEQRIRELAQKQPTSSVVFLEVKLLEEGKDFFCNEISANVASDEGFSTSFVTQDAHTVPFTGRPGNGATYGGIAFLPAGTYTVVSVRCKALVRLNGRFARFRVGPNEIVNTGCLVIDFKTGPMTLFERRTFSGRTSVEGLATKTAQSLAERTPTLFPKAAKRYMASNAATSAPKPSR